MMIDFFVRKFTDKVIRRNIEQGKPIPGMTTSEALEVLRRTKKPNGVEIFGFLFTKLTTKDGIVIPHGMQSCKLVTQDWTQYLVDSFQDSAATPMDAFSYHASGTGTAAESNTDSALGTEVENRVSGTQTEGASANIYQTVATISYSASYDISEHGLFSASSGGTLADRSYLDTETTSVTSGDEIEFTYEMTVNAET